MHTYFDALTNTMTAIARMPFTLFIGQGVACAGTTMTDTLRGVPKEQLIEFPVAEELQLGTCIGMSLEGWRPICVFPRWNFVLRAADQLVNHLDRIPMYSDYRPRVVIRVAVPKTHPFYPGPQHDDDFTSAFVQMFRTIDVVKLKQPEDILPAYVRALESDRSTVLVEYTALYGDAVPSGVK